MPSTGGYTFESGGELSFDLAAVDFNDDSFGPFTTYSRASNHDWTIEERGGQKGAVANSYGADEASDDWLISPALEVGAGAEIEVSFDLYRKYGGPELEVMVSSDYTGSGDGRIWEMDNIELRANHKTASELAADFSADKTTGNYGGGNNLYSLRKRRPHPLLIPVAVRQRGHLNRRKPKLCLSGRRHLHRHPHRHRW